MTSTTFAVTGMTCEHCEASVREEVSEIPGVSDIQVSADNGVLVVTGEGVDEAAVLAAVTEAGYTASLA
ncbi:heavy-metal-associated domain-containing protein [Naumannella halotolerans]|uniref:heavy-metal-associated domain-containing protein n=1 Tax=Naumannella halotolerans TaxID=993414 RepID=UPI00370D385B